MTMILYVMVAIAQLYHVMLFVLITHSVHMRERGMKIAYSPPYFCTKNDEYIYKYFGSDRKYNLIECETSICMQTANSHTHVLPHTSKLTMFTLILLMHRFYSRPPLTHTRIITHAYCNMSTSTRKSKLPPKKTIITEMVETRNAKGKLVAYRKTVVC